MKNIINYLGALLAVALIGISFAACTDEDGVSSANVGLGIKAIFPTKVVTNQPLTINGTGLFGATEIEFPGGARVTDFEVVSNDMIRVNTPAGIPEEGGKITVYSADDKAQSRQSLTLGHTNVTGFSKQPNDSITGGDLITVFGSDLEFINSVELLDPDSAVQFIDHMDFYRKGTSNLIFRVPPKNIYEGSFIGYLHTFDGQRIPLPELYYQPASDGGHFETEHTTIWKNDGSLGQISWSGDYRFAPESNSTGEECYTVPQDIWERMKSETFYVTIKGDSPQIRVTTGWWSTTWTGDDIFDGNERLEKLDDGTYRLTVNFAGDPILDALDAQHLLFTGAGYTVDEIFFEEEVWVDGPGDVEVETPVWTNDGSLGQISWSGDYRFAPESNSTGEECYTVPQDVWDRMKSETFYVIIKGDSPQIRVTTGWWSTTWTGDDIFDGNERLEKLDDGTYRLTVNFAGDPILDAIDAQHLLFTGSGYSVEKIYFIDIIKGGGAAPKEVVFWKGDGSAGAVSWSGAYRFALDGHDGNSECIAELPQDVWDKIKTSTFYLDVEATDPQVRITTGWWDPSWNVGDIQPGSEYLTDNGDGTFTVKINISGDATFVEALDDRHLLFTGDRYTPLKLYFLE